MKNYLIPKLRDILFLTFFFAVLLLGPRMLNMDGDLPRHIAVGKYVLEGHLPPVNDIFSHTKLGAPFAPHKWLSGVLFFIAYALFDERGIMILAALAVAATFTWIYSNGVKRTGLRLPILFLVAWGAGVSSLHWIVRPHLFTMLLLAIWLTWTESLASGEKIRWWCFPVLMLIWNNIHGEFISGLLVTFAYLAGWLWDYFFDRAKTNVETGKQLGLAMLTSVTVSILNPVSLRAWGTVTSWLSNDYLMERTQETASPDFLNNHYLILLGMIAFSIFLLGIKRSKLRTGDVITLAGFTILTLTSARNVHLYGVVAPFVLIQTLTGIRSVRVVDRIETLFDQVEYSLKGILYPALTVIAGVILLATTPLGSIEKFSPSFFPIQSVEWLKSNPQEGNMFNTFDWGGYISLHLGPDTKVFIDSQGDIYGEIFIRQYEQVITLQDGWQSVLDQYDVRWALVPTQWILANTLIEDGWQEVYSDTTSIILVKP